MSCYFDNTAYRPWLAGAPSAPVYTDCGTAGDLTVTTGLSIGWGDTYPAWRSLQWIDITGLKSGRYRLRATADPANWFAEMNNANNSTWVKLKLTSSGVKVVAYGVTTTCDVGTAGCVAAAPSVWGRRSLQA
jgi:hypothetical protein